MWKWGRRLQGCVQAEGKALQCGGAHVSRCCLRAMSPLWLSLWLHESVVAPQWLCVRFSSGVMACLLLLLLLRRFPYGGRCWWPPQLCSQQPAPPGEEDGRGLLRSTRLVLTRVLSPRSSACMMTQATRVSLRAAVLRLHATR